MKVAVLDYGVGNLASVLKALAFVDASPERVADPASVVDAGAIVIPGVGHFESTRFLNDSWRDAIGSAIARGVPALGICLGMQWLFEGSTEAPMVPGLGVMAGSSSILSGDVKVPHVGWNSLDRRGRDSVLLRGVGDGAAAYFTHSYAAPVTDAAITTTTHGRAFASTVERGHVMGVQWHPEKSGPVGLAVLSNFVTFAREARPSSC